MTSFIEYQLFFSFFKLNKPWFDQIRNWRSEIIVWTNYWENHDQINNFGIFSENKVSQSSKTFICRWEAQHFQIFVKNWSFLGLCESYSNKWYLLTVRPILLRHIPQVFLINFFRTFSSWLYLFLPNRLVDEYFSGTQYW